MRNGPYTLIRAPEDWPGKLYRARYCYEHHYIYWRAHGVLPAPSECIHHLNGDKRDNRPENLELRGRVDHIAHHNSVAPKRKRRLARRRSLVEW